MNPLKKYENLPIDWDLTPEHAVTMYLEWGNNDWNSQYGPVRSASDESIYFVVDTWEESPKIRLVRRNMEEAIDLTSFPLPEHLMSGFKRSNGNIRGITSPTDEIKDWLRQEMGQELAIF